MRGIEPWLGFRKRQRVRSVVDRVAQIVDRVGVNDELGADGVPHNGEFLLDDSPGPARPNI
jgi:hypothetical protein